MTDPWGRPNVDTGPQWADTIPIGEATEVEPEEYAALIRHLEGNCGTCQQSRHCATPTACECAEQRDDALDAARGIVLGVATGAAFFASLAALAFGVYMLLR